MAAPKEAEARRRVRRADSPGPPWQGVGGRVRTLRTDAPQAASDLAGLPVVLGREGRVPFNLDGGPRSSHPPLSLPFSSHFHELEIILAISL